jgi:hypothetical protein
MASVLNILYSRKNGYNTLQTLSAAGLDLLTVAAFADKIFAGTCIEKSLKSRSLIAAPTQYWARVTLLASMAIGGMFMIRKFLSTPSANRQDTPPTSPPAAKAPPAAVPSTTHQGPLPATQLATRQDQAPRQRYPSLFLAEDGFNQYKAPGPAACTPLSCQFVASKTVASSENITSLIAGNTYTDNVFLDTEQCLRDVHLQLASNPWEAQHHGGCYKLPMEVSFEEGKYNSIPQAVDKLVGEMYIRGAIITANSMTIGMRIGRNEVQFFDPHGDSNINPGSNAAYVMTFLRNQKDLMVQFLQKKFPPLPRETLEFSDGEEFEMTAGDINEQLQTGQIQFIQIYPILSDQE